MFCPLWQIIVIILLSIVWIRSSSYVQKGCYYSSVLTLNRSRFVSRKQPIANNNQFVYLHPDYKKWWTNSMTHLGFIRFDSIESRLLICILAEQIYVIINIGAVRSISPPANYFGIWIHIVQPDLSELSFCVITFSSDVTERPLLAEAHAFTI